MNGCLPSYSLGDTGGGRYGDQDKMCFSYFEWKIHHCAKKDSKFICVTNGRAERKFDYTVIPSLICKGRILSSKFTVLYY